MKRAVIIGAGFGGLALAIRLQAAGVDTTVLEARDRPGGRAYVWHRDRHIFDAGPTAITDPECLAQLWRLSGHDMAQDVTLLPINPHYRISWPDGMTFDCCGSDAAMTAQIARIEPSDVAGYTRFLDYAAGVHAEGYERLGDVPFLDLASMIKASPTLLQHQAWRSVYSIVSGFVKNPRLCEALSFHTLLIGGNPMTTSGIYSLVHRLHRETGTWFPKGGTSALVSAMVTHFERLGGTLRLGDPVRRITMLGDRATGVETMRGMTLEADAVASNADVVHTYGTLLGHHQRGAREADRLATKHWSPGVFMVHFGVEGSWPEIPHHMVLLGQRFADLWVDIFEHGVLPADLPIYLHHPSATDPTMAPEGRSTFYALAPVPHLGKLPVDWNEVGPKLAEHILAELERRLMPGLRERIRLQFTYAPPDFARDLGAHLGSGFGLEPLLSQSAWLRPHHRDRDISNLYFVGAGTHPGASIPGVVASARAAAGLMLKDFT